MPRLAGVNLVGVLLAAIAIYFVGALWYGLIFPEPWMAGKGWTEADFEGQNPLWMAGGVVISLVLAFGLGWHMKQKGIKSLQRASLFGLWLSLLIGVPLMAYGLVYSPMHSVEVFLIDASHTVVTFVAGCIVLSFFD